MVRKDPFFFEKMAVNRIKGAFAVPRKGETFELRAGLVYGINTPRLTGACC